jgi:hypothetical protein
VPIGLFFIPLFSLTPTIAASILPFLKSTVLSCRRDSLTLIRAIVPPFLA